MWKGTEVETVHTFKPDDLLAELKLAIAGRERYEKRMSGELYPLLLMAREDNIAWANKRVWYRLFIRRNLGTLPTDAELLALANDLKLFDRLERYVASYFSNSLSETLECFGPLTWGVWRSREVREFAWKHSVRRNKHVEEIIDLARRMERNPPAESVTISATLLSFIQHYVDEP